MKSAITKVILSVIIGAFAITNVNATNKLIVQIEGIQAEQGGNLLIFLFAQDGFPVEHSKALQTIQLNADEQSKTVQFNQLPQQSKSIPEQFAIKILHDADQNGVVTKNWLGVLPIEGLGFSNNAKIRFGPPSFEDAKLIFSDVQTTITITLDY